MLLSFSGVCFFRIINYEKRKTSWRKWNKKRLGLSILTFGFKLIFQIIWGILLSILITVKWLKNGSQDLVYGDNHEADLTKILDQNEKIIKRFPDIKKTIT